MESKIRDGTATFDEIRQMIKSRYIPSDNPLGRKIRRLFDIVNGMDDVDHFLLLSPLDTSKRVLQEKLQKEFEVVLSTKVDVAPEDMFRQYNEQDFPVQITKNCKQEVTEEAVLEKIQNGTARVSDINQLIDSGFSVSEYNGPNACNIAELVTTVGHINTFHAMTLMAVDKQDKESASALVRAQLEMHREFIKMLNEIAKAETEDCDDDIPELEEAPREGTKEYILEKIQNRTARVSDVNRLIDLGYDISECNDSDAYKIAILFVIVKQIYKLDTAKRVAIEWRDKKMMSQIVRDQIALHNDFKRVLHDSDDEHCDKVIIPFRIGTNGPTPVELYKELGSLSHLSIIVDKTEELYCDMHQLPNVAILIQDNYDVAKKTLLNFDKLTRCQQNMYMDCYDAVMEGCKKRVKSNPQLKGTVIATKSAEILYPFLRQIIKK